MAKKDWESIAAPEESTKEKNALKQPFSSDTKNQLDDNLTYWEKMIPFDISKKSEIESGKLKLITRDGREVKILSWNAKVDFPDKKYSRPIIGETTTYGHKVEYDYSKDGHYSCAYQCDLFMVTDDYIKKMGDKYKSIDAEIKKREEWLERERNKCIQPTTDYNGIIVHDHLSGRDVRISGNSYM